MWIERDFSQRWQQASLPVRFLTGPRQSGKSSLLRRLLEPERTWLSLDDFATREFALSDPRLFLSQQSEALVLDEVQQAPPLLGEIKRRIDEWRMSDRQLPQPSYWLTGSNQLQIDLQLKESLAGRASYYQLLPLSVHELHQAGRPLLPENLFLRGGWPQLHAQEELDPVHFLNDYLTTVVEKDVVLTAGIQKTREFNRAVRLLAGRTAQLLVVANLAQDAGVKQPTLQDWISTLEQMQVLSCLPPFASDSNKRLLKSPKVYFHDVGLAVRLQGWSEMPPLLVSPAVGAIFETLVYSEILKTARARGRNWQISFLRNKEKEELDFFLEGGNQTRVALEVKWSSQEAAHWTPPKGLRPLVEEATLAVVSFLGGPSRQTAVTHLALEQLYDFLLTHLH